MARPFPFDEGTTARPTVMGYMSYSLNSLKGVL